MQKRFDDFKDNNAVHKTGDETISGNKTFTNSAAFTGNYGGTQKITVSDYQIAFETGWGYGNGSIYYDDDYGQYRLNNIGVNVDFSNLISRYEYYNYMCTVYKNNNNPYSTYLDIFTPYSSDYTEHDLITLKGFTNQALCLRNRNYNIEGVGAIVGSGFNGAATASRVINVRNITYQGLYFLFCANDGIGHNITATNCTIQQVGYYGGSSAKDVHTFKHCHINKFGSAQGNANQTLNEQNCTLGGLDNTPIFDGGIGAQKALFTNCTFKLVGTATLYPAGYSGNIPSYCNCELVAADGTVTRLDNVVDSNPIKTSQVKFVVDTNTSITNNYLFPIPIPDSLAYFTCPATDAFNTRSIDFKIEVVSNYTPVTYGFNFRITYTRENNNDSLSVGVVNKSAQIFNTFNSNDISFRIPQEFVITNNASDSAVIQVTTNGANASKITMSLGNANSSQSFINYSTVYITANIKDTVTRKIVDND